MLSHCSVGTSHINSDVFQLYMTKALVIILAVENRFGYILMPKKYF